MLETRSMLRIKIFYLLPPRLQWAYSALHQLFCCHKSVRSKDVCQDECSGSCRSLVFGLTKSRPQSDPTAILPALVASVLPAIAGVELLVSGPLALSHPPSEPIEQWWATCCNGGVQDLPLYRKDRIGCKVLTTFLY